MSEPLDK